VKGVEDLNICIIGAQGIVGVGATIRICIASFQAAALPRMARDGSPAGPISSCPSPSWRVYFVDCFSTISGRLSMLATCDSFPPWNRFGCEMPS